MSPFLVGLVGYRCAAKSTAGRFIRAAGIPTFENETFLHPLAYRRFGHRLSRAEVAQVFGREGGSIFHTVGPVLRLLVDLLPVVAVDNIKSQEDVATLQAFLPAGRIELLHIRCPFAIRLERFRSRGRERNVTESALLAYDREADQLGLADAVASARWTIDSGGSPGELGIRISAWVAEELRPAAGVGTRNVHLTARGQRAFRRRFAAIDDRFFEKLASSHGEALNCALNALGLGDPYDTRR